MNADEDEEWNEATPILDSYYCIGLVPNTERNRKILNIVEELDENSCSE